MALMLAICRPHPNWMPKNPKLIFHICQKLRVGFTNWMRVAEGVAGTEGGAPSAVSMAGMVCGFMAGSCRARFSLLLTVHFAPIGPAFRRYAPQMLPGQRRAAPQVQASRLEARSRSSFQRVLPRFRERACSKGLRRRGIRRFRNGGGT